VAEDYDAIHRLQDQVSKLEYEADKIKQEIREQIPRRFFLPVDRADLERFLHCQDSIADGAEDLAVILVLRNTRIHPELVEGFRAFTAQVVLVSKTLTDAADELEALAESSFSGAEAQSILERIGGLNEAEWTADRMQRKLSQRIYQLEDELKVIDILFYEKMILALGAIANAADRTGDMLRSMIVKG
jgi:predicted phosphate transport protein (TIGR00153 family)